MRIATWNVERPKNAINPRSRRILEKLHEINADIWILTETHDSITPGEDYYACATEPVREPPKRHPDGERRTIVWSRWPIERIEEDIAHRTACGRINAPAGELIVFGTIIPYSGRDCPPYGPLRRWDAHYAAIGVQAASWQRLQRHHPRSALCVAGDFNQTREGPFTYGTRWGRLLLDLALEQVSLQDTTIPSFAQRAGIDNSAWTLPQGKQPIDHICLTSPWAEHITAVGAWPGKSEETGYLSDHSGVFIDVAPG